MRPKHPQKVERLLSMRKNLSLYCILWEKGMKTLKCFSNLADIVLLYSVTFYRYFTEWKSF